MYSLCSCCYIFCFLYFFLYRKYSDETLLNQINSNRPATATVSQQAYEGRSLIPSSDSASAYNNVAADEMLPGGLAGGLYGGPMKQMPYSRALLDSVESVGLANPVHEIESLQTLQSDATCHVSDTISQYGKWDLMGEGVVLRCHG